VKVGEMLLIANSCQQINFFKLVKGGHYDESAFIAQYILWCHPLGNISFEFQDGWTFYLNIHCHDPLDENALDDELLKFICKEGPFAQEAINLRDSMLALVSWWEKFGIHVPKLQTLALKALSDAFPSSLMDSTASPKVTMVEREIVGACSLAHNITWVEGRVGILGWGLRRLARK